MNPSQIATLLTFDEHQFVIDAMKSNCNPLAKNIVEKLQKSCTHQYEVHENFDRTARFSVALEIMGEIEAINEKLDDAMAEGGDLYPFKPKSDKGNLETINYRPIGLTIDEDQEAKIWLEATGSIDEIEDCDEEE